MVVTFGTYFNIIHFFRQVIVHKMSFVGQFKKSIYNISLKFTLKINEAADRKRDKGRISKIKGLIQA